MSARVARRLEPTLRNPQIPAADQRDREVFCFRDASVAVIKPALGPFNLPATLSALCNLPDRIRLPGTVSFGDGNRCAGGPLVHPVTVPPSPT